MLPITARPPLPHAATVEAPRRALRERPPLRRSIRLEDDEAAAEERRRMFGHGPRAPSFDEGDVSDEHVVECECGRSSLERSGPSVDTPDEDECELEFISSPPPAEAPSHAAKYHLRGVSSDRFLAARDASPAARGPSRAHSQGVFERRLPKIYKFGLLDKSKRASSSALYERTERSPTEAFYNATGSTRLSSQELFEKFCSEDFTSLYGHHNEKRRTPHCKSTGSSGSDVRHERPCCKRLPCASQPALSRRHVYRNPRSDHSTDSEDMSPRENTLCPLPHDESKNPDNGSRSAPLLSPDRFEARFTFDISERSEAPSLRDETPSDATETRNLTLYEEPDSDQTSLCELYDAAFSSQRPSFRKSGAHRYPDGTFDLTTLDFRAIDDESPRISLQSARNTERDDTLRQNSDTHSWASDSVFATPEKRPPDTSPSSAETHQYVSTKSDSTRPDSAAAESTIIDTTVVEEEPSVIERTEYTLALKLGRIELDDVVQFPPSSPAEDSAKQSSRSSMHKLEPIDPERLVSSEVDAASIRSAMIGVRRRRGASEPRRGRSARCFPL